MRRLRPAAVGLSPVRPRSPTNTFAVAYEMPAARHPNKRPTHAISTHDVYSMDLIARDIRLPEGILNAQTLNPPFFDRSEGDVP